MIGKLKKKTGGLFGCNGSVPLPYTNRPFPLVAQRMEGHFHRRNGRPKERSHLCQMSPGEPRGLAIVFPFLRFFFPFPIFYFQVPFFIFHFSFFSYFIFSLFFVFLTRSSKIQIVIVISMYNEQSVSHVPDLTPV